MLWKTCLKVSGYIIVGIAVCLILFVSYFLLSPNYVMSNPTDNAMKPAFGRSDIAIFETVRRGEIGAGQVISFTYQEPGQAKISVTGRVVSQQGDLLITGEDASAEKSSWKMVNVQVKGKYLFKLPLLGYMVQLIKGGEGKYLLIALGSLAFLAILLFELVGSIRARRGGGAEEQPETS